MRGLKPPLTRGVTMSTCSHAGVFEPIPCILLACHYSRLRRLGKRAFRLSRLLPGMGTGQEWYDTAARVASKQWAPLPQLDNGGTCMGAP